MRAEAALLLLSAGLLSACGPSAPPSPAAGATPATPAPTAHLAFEPPAFDFGRVLPGRPMRKQFTLRNLTGEAVAVTSVTTDCGCLLVGDHPRMLAPGAAAPLTIQLTTPDHAGPVVRNVVVHTGTAGAETVGLTLRATVIAEGNGPG
jgi:hypothetical protein